jgi:opine dehydrogenase
MQITLVSSVGDDNSMRVAVLGSGNGGCAVAYDWAAHKHYVSLFDFERFPDNIKRIQENGGIYAEGELEGSAPIAYVGHNIEKAMSGSEIVFAVGPAYSTKPFAEGMK